MGEDIGHKGEEDARGRERGRNISFEDGLRRGRVGVRMGIIGRVGGKGGGE